MITFASMKHLSILIPTYNDPCYMLVSDLQQQASRLPISYEIIVADDGSKDQTVIEQNRHINEIENCRVIERGKNSGRAIIRNYLAQQARYDWLLFIDSDMVVCRKDFVQRYAETEADVVDGGIIVGKTIEGNLRSMYEKASEHQHTMEKRQLSPYKDFHTANFLIRRDIMLAHPFDERFRCYGYEDVLVGKELQRHGIPILHIDNPLSFEIYESNEAFVSKTEEGLRTLFTFRNELEGYSRLLAHREHLTGCSAFIRLFHRLFKDAERRNLCSDHPSLFVFNLYRLGYFFCLR